jgi:DNA (cytosine-5)-methyltransferase 1
MNPAVAAAAGASSGPDRFAASAPAALDLFSGIGGMALAVHAAFPGLRLWRLCEASAACREVLARRFPGVPCEADVAAMRGDPAAGVALVYGGFPCQDVSTAGRGLGVERGARSSLFGHMIRLAGECRAPFLLMENVAALRSNGLDVVCARLREAGYAEIRWLVLGADAVGMRHMRRRLFLAARNPALAAAAEAAAAEQGRAPLTLSLRPLDELLPLRPEPPGTRLQPRPARGPEAAAWRGRVHMLGNACVPRQGLAAVRALFGVAAAAAKEALPTLPASEAWRSAAAGPPSPSARRSAFASREREPRSGPRPRPLAQEEGEAEEEEGEEEQGVEGAAAAAAAAPLIPPPVPAPAAAAWASEGRADVWAAEAARGPEEAAHPPGRAIARTLIASDSLHVIGRLLNRTPSGGYASMSTPRWVRHNPEPGTWGVDARAVAAPGAERVMSLRWAEWFMGFPEGWLEGAGEAG